MPVNQGKNKQTVVYPHNRVYLSNKKNNSRKNEETSQSKNNMQLWMGLVMEVNSNAVKSNIA